MIFEIFFISLVVGSTQYKQYNNRIREEKNNLYKQLNYV